MKAYFKVTTEFELIENSPTCELHFEAQGNMGHIMKAITSAFTKVLSRPDLVHSDGRPLVNDARLGLFSRRLECRIKALHSDETMLFLPPCFIEWWSDAFDCTDFSAKMTRNNYNLVMLLFGHIVRDFITQEVNST